MKNQTYLHRRPNRRDFLATTAGGIGNIAVTSLLAQQSQAESTEAMPRIDPLDPLLPRDPHFPARAKNVIFLYMYGGPSQVDTFDYKPELFRLNGQPVPDSIKQISDKVGGVFNSSKDKLMAGPWKFKQRGESGLWISDLLPHTAQHADKLCVIRSMYCDSSNHAPATYQMNTGSILGGRPSLGSWLTYGLGSENQNLPGYVLLFKVGGLGGSANWSNGFLPAAFQGTRFRETGSPVLNLRPPNELAGVQRSTLDAIQAFNQKHREARPGVLDLDGRIASYELAYRMQSEAMQIGDMSGETQKTQTMYGLDDSNKDMAKFGRMCLQARRLVEKGVRVVQLYNAVDKLAWDSHTDNTENHNRNAAQTDKPIAALLTDLNQRGMLDDTLVVWASEFGRTPMEQGNGGRNHNPYGFTVWMAGGGVRGGQTIGATDEIGLRAEQNPHHVKDFHATILAAMGIHNDDLFFSHHGRDERLTGVAGVANPIPGVFL
jgi:hypothetical protein